MSKGDRKAARIAQRAQREGAQNKPYGSFKLEGAAEARSVGIIVSPLYAGRLVAHLQRGGSRKGLRSFSSEI